MWKVQGNSLNVMFKNKIYRYYLVVIFATIVIIFSIVLHYEYYVMSGRMLIDAKNIQLAMRMVAIEYMGNGDSMYVYGSPYGMNSDTIVDIKSLSGVNDGEITLVAWNTEDNVPAKFYFQKNNYLVVYEYDVKQKELLWDIYRIQPILELGK